MNAIRFARALGILVLGLGCSSGYDVAPPPGGAKPAQPHRGVLQPDAPSAQGRTSEAKSPEPAQPTRSAITAGQDATGARSAAPAPSSPAPTISVRLSTGVALPQTLPEGTAMGFSVEYQVTQGQPLPAERYYWVIERAQGPPARLPVQLQPRGTLERFFSDFRPEHGPFQTHLEDSRGNRISASEPLR